MEDSRPSSIALHGGGAKPPSAALPCPATRPRAVRRQSRPRPARGRTRPAGPGVRRLRRRRTGGCGRSGRARAGPILSGHLPPLGNQLPDDLHHVDRGVEHDQVAQQRAPFDQLFLLGRVVLGDHTLVAEPGSRRRTRCRPRPCWWPRSPVPAAPSRRGEPQQRHGPHHAPDLPERLVDQVLREFDENRRISVTEDTLHCEEPF